MTDFLVSREFTETDAQLNRLYLAIPATVRSPLMSTAVDEVTT